MNRHTLMLANLLFIVAVAFGQVPAPDVQIAGAIQAAPQEMRDGAAVLGFGAAGDWVILREGTNELICLADDPAREGFNVACYHADLEPFMARGRALTAQKITGQKRVDMRYQEIEAGTLKMPKEPRTLYVLTGSAFDPISGSVEKSYLRWVIYVPYATAESTGLSTKPGDGKPWLMFPGTPGAHIMISPPKN